MTTPREQLANIIVESSCDCDHPTPCGWCRGLADTIIQAGWTAPELPKPFDADCKTCGLERQEALENAGQGFWHIRMFLCPNCGNKRCPKAENHRHKCTGSNEPNQTPELDN